MGDFGTISWTWESSDTDVRVGYLPMRGRISIVDLIVYMEEVAPGVDPGDIDVNWATVKWTRPATPAELVERRERHERWERRHEAWERKTLADLTKKYGVPGTG